MRRQQKRPRGCLSAVAGPSSSTSTSPRARPSWRRGTGGTPCRTARGSTSRPGPRGGRRCSWPWLPPVPPRSHRGSPQSGRPWPLPSSRGASAPRPPGAPRYPLAQRPPGLRRRLPRRPPPLRPLRRQPLLPRPQTPRSRPCGRSSPERHARLTRPAQSCATWRPRRRSFALAFGARPHSAHAGTPLRGQRAFGQGRPCASTASRRRLT
mmetsp:Transcript_11339/g.23460  ORF Transcript_11339/g.23460 Transcript_11339/m.23460 type:complete len:209 (+) Transcript_11339:215-841(+)